MSPETARDTFIESLYERNYNKLKVSAYAKLKNMPVAEELAQETFLIALRDYETLCGHENPDGYLWVTLKYKVFEYIRARNRYLKLFLSLDRDVSPEVKAPSNTSPTSTESILEEARKTLSKEEWYLLERFAIDGASHRQIAEELNITVDASQKRLERIRKKLEDVLPE